MGRRGAARRPDRGAAAVEAALVLPLMLLILFAIVDFGRMINAQLKVTEAAREGARAASFNADASPRVSTVMGGLTDVTIASAGCPADPGPGDDATVTVTYQFQFVTPFGALAGIVTGPQALSSTGVVPCRG
jgi:hypothetical protein